MLLFYFYRLGTVPVSSKHISVGRIMTSNKEWWVDIGKGSPGASASKNYHKSKPSGGGDTIDGNDDASENASDGLPSKSAALKSIGIKSRQKRLLIIGVLSLVLIVPILLYHEMLFETTSSNFQNNEYVKNNSGIFSMLTDFVANGANFNALKTSAGAAKQPTTLQDESLGGSTLDDPISEENGSSEVNNNDDPSASSTHDSDGGTNVLSEPISSMPDVENSQSAGNNDQYSPESSVQSHEITGVLSEFNDDNFGILMSNPSMFIGYDILVTGQISSISYEDDRNLSYDTDVGSNAISQIRSIEMVGSSDADIQNPWFVLLHDESVSNIGPDSEQLKVGDCLRVTGEVRSSSYHRTSLGEEVRVPVISAQALERIPCIDSSMPALHTIELDLSNTIGDVTLTAKRVQFSADHTRIELEARNTGINDKTFLRAKESIAIYKGVAYSDISHMPKFAEYRIDSVLLPGTSTTGYLFFEPIVVQEDGFTELISFNITVEESKITEDKRSNFVFNVNYLAEEE